MDTGENLNQTVLSFFAHIEIGVPLLKYTVGVPACKYRDKIKLIFLCRVCYQSEFLNFLKRENLDNTVVSFFHLGVTDLKHTGCVCADIIQI